MVIGLGIFVVCKSIVFFWLNVQSVELGRECVGEDYTID